LTGTRVDVDELDAIPASASWISLKRSVLGESEAAKDRSFEREWEKEVRV
jgi:hypothetical protein